MLGSLDFPLDGLGGRMRRGRTRLAITIGIVVAAVAIVIAVIHGNSDTSPEAASSAQPPASAGPGSQVESVPVVVPKASGSSSYLSAMHPSGKLGELVNSGPVKIGGAIYPKSISFYCNVGDPTAFPSYTLKKDARRFQATVGLGANPPPQFQAGLMVLGDGRTLRTFSVTAPRPKTVAIDVKGVHRLQLECFGSGNSVTGGEAVAVAWGNARLSG